MIICTRDRPEALRNCVEGVASQGARPDKIVVVAGTPDSAPDDLGAVAGGIPIEIVPCPEMNICRSRNIGLAHCTGEVAVFIDDDAVPREGWLARIVDEVRRDGHTWIVGGHVFDARVNPSPLEFAFGTLRRSGRQTPVRSVPFVPDSISGASSRGELPTVKGCNFAVLTDRAREVGGFDEFFAFGYDEADLVVRILDAGGRVGHVPDASVDHWHTPGLFRSAHPLDRDWGAELASHTYFGLKHSRGRAILSVWVRVLVRARVAKIAALGLLETCRGRVPVGAVLRAVGLAFRGIRKGERAASGVTSPIRDATSRPA